MFSIRARKHRDGFVLDVAIQVGSPGVVALFGRSGCGKTTLANIIAGLLPADEAHIEIDGVPLDANGKSLRAEHRRIGYVFQDARLFPHLDVMGNLRYGETRAKRFDSSPAPASPRITLDMVAPLLGLEPLLSRRVNQLSGGERQRVALGRALLSQPRLLLLDEPLASLDAARREEVLPYLEKLRDELAIPMIYVSHQFEEVLRLATHVVLMDRGKVLSQGTLDELSLHPELRAIVGPDAVGAVLHGTVTTVDGGTGLATVRIGDNSLRLNLREAKAGAAVRVQLLARDIILATSRPENLSVRNVMTGTVSRVVADDAETDLVYVDIGGAHVLSRVTRAASIALDLRAGSPIWVLVKSVSIRDTRSSKRRRRLLEPRFREDRAGWVAAEKFQKRVGGRRSGRTRGDWIGNGFVRRFREYIYDAYLRLDRRVSGVHDAQRGFTPSDIHQGDAHVVRPNQPRFDCRP
jgi:molybdate transport system ATP-binding protein